ncbi:hypothetical protein [uncultured Tenacibaculum sp.]|uniref:hypothetical protein n=1 Tax=uncultured Tenacibaculum sp. TaxID=174713 RepID=UPI00261A0126|nr:hypothetical protein [uncultured Tenacibaculum sp.]
MLNKLSFQEHLSLGYLFLVVLGLVSEAIFYGFLDINYLEYVSILDALFSPISLLINNKLLFGVFIFFMLLTFFWIVRFPKIHKKNKDKKWYRKLYKEDANKKGIKVSKKSGFVFVVLYFLFALLLGFRLGAGINYKKKLTNIKFKSDCLLIFKDNSKLKVKKIGQNSAYIFYVEEKDSVVTATPILDNIKQIKRIKKEK